MRMYYITILIICFINLILNICEINCRVLAIDNDNNNTNINNIQTILHNKQQYHHERRKSFTIEELINTKFSHAISDDLDLDVCKAGK